MTYSTKLTCPIQRTIAMIADKWKVIVIANLGEGTMRFRELQRAMQGVTPKVLTRQLRDLEHDGLVTRKAYAEIPPRVEYSLTALGRSSAAHLAAASQLGGRQLRNAAGATRNRSVAAGRSANEEVRLAERFVRLRAGRKSI